MSKLKFIPLASSYCNMQIFLIPNGSSILRQDYILLLQKDKIQLSALNKRDGKEPLTCYKEDNRWLELSLNSTHHVCGKPHTPHSWLFKPVMRKYKQFMKGIIN